MRITSVSLSSYDLWLIWWGGALFSWWTLYPLSLINSASSSEEFPEPWRQGFGGDIPIMAECFPRSLYSLHVWLWVSMLAPSCCRRKLLWWWLNKTLMDEYRRVSLGLILSVEYFLGQWFIWDDLLHCRKYHISRAGGPRLYKKAIWASHEDPISKQHGLNFIFYFQVLALGFCHDSPMWWI